MPLLPPSLIPTAPPPPNESDKAARTRPRDARRRARPPVVPASPPNLSPRAVPSPPTRRSCPCGGLGKGERGAGAPRETFQGGKAPDGEDKDERAELS